MGEPFTFGGPNMGPISFRVSGPPRMFGFFKNVFLRNKKITVAAAAAFIGLKIYKYIRMKNLRKKWADAGKDVVVLHTTARGYVHPSLSPFPVKLETFLRMTGIEYVLDFECPMGPKHKVPWITLNGEDYSDSELIIQMLQKKFKKFPDEGVPESDLAIGVAMQIMFEEYTYWGLAHWRYVEDRGRGALQVCNPPLFFRFMIKHGYRSVVKKALYHQGLGRHSRDELYTLVKRTFKSLSDFLGNKQFLLGDKPHVVDCAIFALICQLLDNTPRSPFIKWINEDYPNLRAYSDRMKAKYWPDWDKIVTRPGLVVE